MSVSIKTEHEIELMREAGHLLEKVHDGLIPYIKPGVSTKVYVARYKFVAGKLHNERSAPARQRTHRVVTSHIRRSFSFQLS